MNLAGPSCRSARTRRSASLPPRPWTNLKPQSRDPKLSTIRTWRNTNVSRPRPRAGLWACGWWFLSTLLALFNFCAGAGESGRIEKSGDWDRIQDGEYLIENCTWNVKAATNKWQEAIFCDPATGSRGWRWDFTGENGATKTYPEIIYGRKPYSIYKSTTSRWPTPPENHSEDVINNAV